MKRIARKLAKSNAKPDKEDRLGVPSSNDAASPSTSTLVGQDSTNAVSVACDATLTKKVPTRLEVARQKMLNESAELSDLLSLYNSKDGGSIVIEINNPDFSSPNIAAIVEEVLIKQRSQKPSIASKVGGFLGKIYPLASLTLGLGAATSEATSFAPVKGAINALSLLYSIAEEERTRSEDFLQQLERISYQALRVGEVQAMRNITIGELLLEKSANLMAAIIQFLKSAVLFFRHDYFYNLGKTILLGPKIYADGRANLDQAIAEYDQALLLEVTIKILNMAGPTPAPPEPVDRQKLRSLLEWLQSSASEVEAQFTNNCEARAPGTLQWVLECEEFKNWRLQQEINQGKRSLWLNGVPGVGKSVIAAYIAQVLKAQHPDSIVLYFFCKAGSSNLNNLHSIIWALARQLAQADPVCRDRLQQLKDEGFQGSKSVSSLFASLVRDVVSEVSRPLFIVVDGLDECFEADLADEDATKKFLEGFETLNAKLLISSRPTPEITRALHFGFKKILTFEDSRDDIGKYVAMRVSRSINLQKGFSRISKEPGKFVTEKSDGNFLWVRIVLDLLERTPSAKAFHTALQSLPRAIGGVYDKILDKLKIAGTIDAAITILECVLFSVRAMTISELHVATALMSDEILDLQGFVEADCGSFLVLAPGKTGPTVHIVHETFRAYITDTSTYSNAGLLPARSHARIAVACLACMTKAETDDSDEELGLEMECFQDYAFEHWDTHLKNSRDTSQAADYESVLALLMILHEFLHDETALRDWMRHLVFLRSSHNDVWNIGVLMADYHDDLLDWIRSDIVSSTLAESKNRDQAAQCPENVALWRAEVCEPDSKVLAKIISTNFSWVWLNTYWKTYTLAKQMFAGALRLARILQLAGEPLEEESPVQWPAGFGPDAYLTPEQKSKPGWTWRYPSSISTQWIVSPEQLSVVAASANYDGSVSLNAGNYAIGEHYAKSPHCVQSFQIAVDENPERWFLYEGLGNWYEAQNDETNAIQYYGMAMELDPEIPPSCALDYYTLLADVKTREGDLLAAEECFRKGAMMKKGWYGNVYWNRMAKIYEDIKDWENVKRVRREAIEKHPVCASVYWDGLASAYGNALDWRGHLEVLFEAIQEDPKNEGRYKDAIKSLGNNFGDLQHWEPAIEIFTTAVEKHPVGKATYQRELARIYCSKGESENWRRAALLLEEVIEGKKNGDSRGEYGELATCYLGLGEFSKCHAALALSVYKGISSEVGPAYMVAGEFQKAIQALRSELTWRSENIKDLSNNEYHAESMMGLHMNLGLCYEASGRDIDARTGFTAAVMVFEKFAEESKNEILNRREGLAYHRSDARPLYKYGLMLEKLGRLQDAKEYYYPADFVCEITTFINDDDILTSEAEDIKEALNRVTMALDEGGLQKTVMPDLLEKVGSVLLKRRLCQRFRTNWYAYDRSMQPKIRGGRSGYNSLFLKGVEGAKEP